MTTLKQTVSLLATGSLLLLAAAPPTPSSPLRTQRALRRLEQKRPAGRSVPGSTAQARILSSPSLSASAASSAVKSFGRLPLAFEENRGQTDRRVRFLSRGPGYTLFLTGDEAVLRLSDPGGAASGPHPRPAARCAGTRSPQSGSKIDRQMPAGEGRGEDQRGVRRSASRSQSPLSSSSPSRNLNARVARWRGAGGEDRNPAPRTASSVRLRLLGADAHARVTGEAPLPGRSNYLRGSDPAKWRTNVPQYARVRCQQVYPGIDAVYYGNQEGRLEYDFELAPGADPNRIRLAFSGARGVELAANGDLLLRTAAGTLRQHKPVAYQLVDGRPVPVTAGYVLAPASGGQGGKRAREQGRRGAEGRQSGSSTRPHVHTPRQLSIDLGYYDPTRPLVIDPVLSFSTYLGGSGFDNANGVAVDAAGSIYLFGETSSANFPTTPGSLDTSLNGSSTDAFVAKLDATGSTLLYSTYMGGTGWELPLAIAVGADGTAYLTGGTTSLDFPTVNPVQAANGSGQDCFVSRLSADGSTLLYSTYLGGNNGDAGLDIAVDPAGNACVAGNTSATNFPTVNALQPSRSGPLDAFVAKLPPAGAPLVYSTYLGGSAGEEGHGIAVDAAGSAYITGGTESTDFPTANPLQAAHAGGSWDAFVTKLNASGSARVYSTYLGGAGSEFGHGIATDASGNAFVGGATSSANFPTLNPLQPASAGGTDAFVTKLNASGSALVYSTYLGGAGIDRVWNSGGLAVDAAGNAVVTGETQSANFPVATPVQPAPGGGRDAFAAQLNASGSALLFSTYLGGSGDNDTGRCVAADLFGNLYVCGATNSANFPVLNPYQATLRGTDDAFLVKIATGPPPAPPAGPSNLTATAVSQTRIDLAWQDNAGDESGFRIERWNGTVFFPVATVGANVTSYSNTGLAAATTYRYRVLAFNAGGDSAPSNTAEATTLPNPPAAPSNLLATALSQTEIRLTWNENASNEDAIEVWRSTGGPFALHAGLGPNQTSYLDPNLTAATLYVYQVRAVNEGGNSAFSNQAGATTLPNPPAAPSNLTATAVSGSQINLAWADNATNETEFVLEVSSDGGTTFAFLATKSANSTSHSHTGLTPETTRHYRVKARNAGGESAWSNVAFATTPQVPPAAPTNLTAAALSASEIRLTWNDVSGEQGYRLERRQGNDPFAFVANVGQNATTHTDGGLQANKVYVYRVLAFNPAGNSGWSNEASARTLRARPRPPHSLNATAASATQVDLAWGDDNEDEQGFLLERSENAGASWSQVASLPANVTRASDTSAQGDKNYQYRLKAWNDVGQSDPSNVASVTTPAGVALASLTVTPAAVRGRRNATGKVTLTGAAPSGGVSVTLSSSNVAASVPSSVTVAAGATEATFAVTTQRVRRNTRVTLTATLAAVQKTATLTVRK